MEHFKNTMNIARKSRSAKICSNFVLFACAMRTKYVHMIHGSPFAAAKLTMIEGLRSSQLEYTNGQKYNTVKSRG